MRYLFTIFMVVVLSGCSSMKTNSDYDPDINFSELTRYAWVVQSGSDSSYQLDGLLEQRVHEAVDAELAKKGFILTQADSADILVNYFTKVDKKVNVDTFSTSFGYSPYYGRSWRVGSSYDTHTRVREYDVGTLIIDMVSTKTGKLIWRGSVSDTVRESNTPEEREETVNTAISKVLEQYPPSADK